MIDKIKDVINQNKRVYNLIAKHFSSTRNQVWDSFRPFAAYIKKSDAVLDLGCGNGRVYQILADLSVRYVGVDQSEELIALAREHNPNLDFRVMEMSQLDFPDAEFDVVFLLAVLHHSPTREHRLATLREIARVLKPGGYVIMTNWNLHSDWAKTQLETGNWKLGGSGEYVVPWKNDKGEILGERVYFAYSPEELEELLHTAGLTVDKQYYDKTWWAKDVSEGSNIVTIAQKALV